MGREMPQKLAGRMGMGKSGDWKLYAEAFIHNDDVPADHGALGADDDACDG
jgi:hypothetical protein